MLNEPISAAGVRGGSWRWQCGRQEMEFTYFLAMSSFHCWRWEAKENSQGVLLGLGWGWKGKKRLVVCGVGGEQNPAAYDSCMGFGGSVNIHKFHYFLQYLLHKMHTLPPFWGGKCVIWSKKYGNQFDFSIAHLVISMCRVTSCVVGKECL